MALFTDEAAVYGAFGKLFSDIIADEKTVGVLVRTNTILQLQLKDPRSTVTVAVRQGQEPLIYFGQTTRRPEVFLQMDADTAHGWLLGEINPTVAFGDNRIKSRGPSSQILAVLAWAKVLTPRYKVIIEENGGELPPPLAPPAPKPEPEAKPEVAAPAEAAAPVEEAAAPVEEATAPVEEATAPGEEARPAAEAPAPAAEEPAPAVEEPAPAVEEPVADPAPAEEVPVPVEETPEQPAPSAEETPEQPAPAAEDAPAAPAEEPAPPADATATPERAPDPAPEDEAPTT
ncbi:MAG: sterol-binding protein [Solirubrobacterales bacterium]|nr:sterol-binding protein [Solirubrobacterales bacterium]